MERGIFLPAEEKHMKLLNLLFVAVAAIACFALTDPVCAGTLPTIGEGSAILSIDRSATFDNLDFTGSGTPLSDYASGGLYIRTNGNSFYGDDARGTIFTVGIPFNPFHLTISSDYSYANVGGGFYFPYEADPGNYDWVTIQTTDGKKIYGLEFLYGNGWTTGAIHGPYPWGNSGAYLDWKTLVGGTIVSSGQVGIAETLPVGTVVGFRDPDGFDQLMVRSPHPNSVDPNFQELAIDNLNVALSLGGTVSPFIPDFSPLTIPTQEIRFPQFAVGGGWEADLTLVAQGGDASSGSIYFLTPTGQPMLVTVDGNLVNGSQDFTLLSKSSITYKLTGGSQTQSGWIVVSEAIAGTGSKGSISGLLTFRYRVGGSVISQVGVAGLRELHDAHLPYDNTGGNLSAFAVCSIPLNALQITRYDAQGTFQEQKMVDLAQLSQQALYVYEMFPASINTAGYLTISGVEGFGLLALNINDSKWSNSAGLPAVYERQIDITNKATAPVKFILEGQFIHGVIEMSPGVISPVSGVISYSPSGGMVLYLNLSSFLTTGQAVTAILTARIPDLNFQNVNGIVTNIYEDGTTQNAGSFHLYPLPSAQF
jgi:hypothetical protein